MTAPWNTTVRELYADLGITLRPSNGPEAAVRCFASPEGHRHDDRHPSASVNLASGAWFCHACGARGGAYDAAILRGHTPRSAMNLLISHGLAEPRARRPRPGMGGRRMEVPPVARATPPPAAHAVGVSSRQIAAWGARLAGNRPLLDRLLAARGITPAVLAQFDVGYDGRRITIPTRSADGALTGLLRWKPFNRGDASKMLAAAGSRRDLFPAPETLTPGTVILCEGEPDVLAARSARLVAVSIPGAASWRAEWARRFAGSSVVIAFDCDVEGRRAARDAGRDLRAAGVAVTVVDLDPARHDGYDLTDHLLAGHPITIAPHV